MLPLVASFPPEVRNAAIDKVKAFLKPGAQRSSGGSLLPAIGIVLQDERIICDAKVLPAPLLRAAGVEIPKDKCEFWAPTLGRSSYSVDPKKAVEFNVVVFYPPQLSGGSRKAEEIFEKIRRVVNNINSTYRFGSKPIDVISTGDGPQHWGAIEKFLGGRVPPNLFVLDFVKPQRTGMYHCISEILIFYFHLTYHFLSNSFSFGSSLPGREKNSYPMWHLVPSS